jgi:hypothetical protein
MSSIRNLPLTERDSQPDRVWVTRSVVRPVKALGEQMTGLDTNDLTELSAGLDAVASNDLTYGVTPVTAPIAVTSRDEVGRLSATFNRRRWRRCD